MPLYKGKASYNDAPQSFIKQRLHTTLRTIVVQCLLHTTLFNVLRCRLCTTLINVVQGCLCITFIIVVQSRPCTLLINVKHGRRFEYIRMIRMIRSIIIYYNIFEYEKPYSIRIYSNRVDSIQIYLILFEYRIYSIQ